MKSKMVIGIFVMAKLLVHFITNTNYSFHRDEYLYLDQGMHLGWGYLEVPPMIAVIASFAHTLGGNLFVVRLFPALVGALSIWLIGHFVRELGGKNDAIAIACFAFLISPAYLSSNTLFQPVSFNQFFWLLSAYLLIRINKYGKENDWYWLGITIGLGFLTKYSILFYLFALGLAFLFNRRNRSWLLRKEPYLAALIALLIVLPNLIWQYYYNWPVVRHMADLQSTQLVHVKLSSFLLAQLSKHGPMSFIWLAGLWALLSKKQFANYRFIGIAFLLTIILIGSLRGKVYYTTGAFSILFAFGGLFINNQWKTNKFKWTFMSILILCTLPLIPYALPILKIEKMQNYCELMVKYLGFNGPLRWEDGQYYSLPQDYADMHGWEDMVKKVSEIYHQLSPEEQKHCMIYGGSYGHAGAVNYHRKNYQLPEAYSFNSSYILWAPEKIEFDRQIMVDDRLQDGSDWFAEMTLVDSLDLEYARDPGYIYYREKPKVDVIEQWGSEVNDRRLIFH